jgi:tRNA(fMet)-specific endonuclease VapC
MHYLLDTDICIYLIKNHPPEVQRRFRQHPLRNLHLSSISLFELRYGVSKSHNQRTNQAALDAFLQSLEPVEFDAAAGIIAAECRASLERKGTPIGPYDLLIAGVALSRDMTLVSNNVREFSRIEGLRVENWAARPIG